MRSRISRPILLLAAAATLLAATGLATAAPPTPEDVDAFRQAWYGYLGSLPRDEERDETAIAAWLDEHLAARWDPAEMDLASIKMVSNFYGGADAEKAKLMERLAEIAGQPDADGCEAAAMTQSISSRGADAPPPDLARVLDHPGFEAALREGKLARMMGGLPYMPAESVAPYRDRLATIVMAIDSIDSMEDLSTVAGLGEGIARPEVGFDEATRDRILDHVVAVIEKGGEAAEDERMKSVCRRRAEYLDGPAGRGRLIDHAAPELTFLWSSDTAMGTKLSDLEGKVVVVDFWATWCGPCIGSFPNMRELVARYEGYDVVIVGATSVQGTHYGADGQVDCTDDPQKEFGLMTGFIAEKEMTWPVVFIEGDVFNPAYGVSGIPHVTIIDPEGVVRYNGLHPANPLAEKAEKIDGLLQKAGRKAPEPVEATPASDAG